MNYRIDYPGPTPTKNKNPKSGRLAVMTGAFFLTFLLLVKSFWPAGADKLQSILIPGGAENRTAFRQMLVDLRQGENVSDAVSAFCRQVIEHAS